VPACGPGVSDVQLVVCEGLDIGGKLVKQLQGSPGTRTTPSRGPPRPVDGRIGDEASFIVFLLYSLIDKYFEDKDLPKEKEHLKQEEDNIIEFAKQLMKDPSSN